MSTNTPVEVNPRDCAQWTLDFLEECILRGRDQERFAICRSFLRAIMSGQLAIVPLPTAPAEVASAQSNGSDAPAQIAERS